MACTSGPTFQEVGLLCFQDGRDNVPVHPDALWPVNITSGVYQIFESCGSSPGGTRSVSSDVF